MVVTNENKKPEEEVKKKNSRFSRKKSIEIRLTNFLLKISPPLPPLFRKNNRNDGHFDFCKTVRIN